MNRRIGHSRREFIKRGTLFVPAIFIPRLIRAQTILTADGLAAFKKKAASGGGGGGGPLQFITAIGSPTKGSGVVWKAGFQFSPSVALTVTALGRFVASASSNSHTVRLWDAGATGSTCSGIDIASASVSLSGVSAGSVAWQSITGVALTAGRFYNLFTDETNNGDQYYNDSAVLTTTSDGVIAHSEYNDGLCHVGTNGVRAYGIPNFQYTTP